MNLNLQKHLKLLAIASITIMAAGCQKDANTAKPVKSAAVTPSLAGLLDTAAATRSFFISNCGLATLTAPVAGNGTVIKPVGRILAVNQPAGEAALPATISFGPPTGPSGAPKYTLNMQGDGNLVLYLTGTTTSLWDSQKLGGAAPVNAYLVLQSDGNLVLQDRAIVPPGTPPPALQEYWASHDVLCPGQQAPVLVLQSDGNIVEEYPCTPVGDKTYGFIGNTGTGGGTGSNHRGKF